LASSLTVLVTCTKRKTRDIPTRLMVRSLPAGTIEQRSEEWINRLSDFGRDRVPAVDLYSGDHWSVARSLPEVAAANGYKADLWVCSAGYGLVKLDAPINAYSATYSATHPDSVGRKVRGLSAHEALPAWWGLLSAWTGPDRGFPRSIRDLTAGRPRTPIWVVASETYLRAIAEDLRAALRCLADPDLLAIFSAGTDVISGLTEHLVPCDARFQSVVGGARRSLNVRLARKALLDLAEGAARVSALKARFSGQLAALPKTVRSVRMPMTDNAVRTYIRRETRRNPGVQHTPLLRRLRDSGYACEQRRFAQLFAELNAGGSR
jgi:hypothetical protein